MEKNTENKNNKNVDIADTGAGQTCINSHDLIVTIVKKGNSETILKASKHAGAEGGTIVYGRGAGIRETSTLMGIPVEPEKEIVFTVILKSQTQEVMKAIIEAANLNKPGTGIIFVLDIKQVAGICHFAGNM